MGLLCRLTMLSIRHQKLITVAVPISVVATSTVKLANTIATRGKSVVAIVRHKLMSHWQMRPPNNTLQVTFDPPPTFAVAKAGVASNAPERGR